MADILNSTKTGLKLFDDGVLINKQLTKWKNATVSSTKKGTTFIVPQTMSDPSTGERTRIVDIGAVSTLQTNTNSITIINNSESWGFPDDGSEEAKKYDFSDIASMELRELTKYINDHNFTYVLTKTGRYGQTYDDPFVNFKEIPNDTKLSFKDKVKFLFKKTEKPEMDVIAFFTNIKATSKKSFDGYVNRVEKYLKAIHDAKLIGQEALAEKLMREMVANKYESFLAAEGYYHVVTEEQVMEFAKKSERGISLDYVKNYVRPIPQDVVDKIAEADQLEVFDNYVIMHYDPKGKARQDTAKEEAKKRDPIVFGVIAGSTKLYYITDWVDEYCDLTLEKFVDTLKITKDDLIQDEDVKAELAEHRVENAVKEDVGKVIKEEEKKENALKKNTTKKKKKTKKEE